MQILSKKLQQPRTAPELSKMLLFGIGIVTAASGATPVVPGMKSFGIAIKQSQLQVGVEKTVHFTSLHLI